MPVKKKIRIIYTQESRVEGGVERQTTIYPLRNRIMKTESILLSNLGLQISTLVLYSKTTSSDWIKLLFQRRQNTTYILFVLTDDKSKSRKLSGLLKNLPNRQIFMMWHPKYHSFKKKKKQKSSFIMVRNVYSSKDTIKKMKT